MGSDITPGNDPCAAEEGFFELALRPNVRTRALRMAFIVGPLIGILNHGDKIFSGAMGYVDWLKFSLTFIVPFSVSTWSSVMAIRDRMRGT